MNGFQWVESHGIECLMLCYVFSMITGVMPPLPMGKGWWTKWLYNIIQVLGANAKNLVEHSPAGKQLEASFGSSIENKPDGSQTIKELTMSSETIIPKAT